MTTLKVLCNKETHTPIQTLLKTKKSGHWRFGSKRQPFLKDVDKIMIYDDETKQKIVGVVTDYYYEESDGDLHGGGYVFEFEIHKPEVFGVTRSWGTTRPLFNQDGIDKQFGK